MSKSDATILGLLPTFAFGGTAAIVYGLAVYAFAIGCVLAILNAVGALLFKKKAPKRVRKSLFFLGFGALIYTVAFSLVLNQRVELLLVEDVLAQVSLMKIAAGYYVDTNALLIAVAGLGLSLLFKIFRRRK